MNLDYDSQLSYAAKLMFEASMNVATKLPGLSELKNEMLWTIQGEVLWTFTGFVIRDLSHELGANYREDIEDEILPAVITLMLERVFEWQEGTGSLQIEQHENFLYWYDEAEIGANLTTGFAPSEEALQAMEATGDIPNDTYVTKLCRRVAAATGKDGRSELIQALGRETMRTFESMGFAGLATTLAEARKAERAGAAAATGDSEAGASEADPLPE